MSATKEEKKQETPQQSTPEPVEQPTEQAPVEQSTLESVIEVTQQKRESLVGKAAKRLGINDPSKLLPLLRNVWQTSKDEKPLTDAELFAGLSMIARFGLDPIAREIYVTRDKRGRLMTIVGIDGWLKILNRTPHYDGFEVEINDNCGVIDWVEVKIHSTKRKYPAVYRAYMSEYSKICGFVAQQLPSHMLRVFALKHAARLFTPLGYEVHLQEEADFISRQDQPNSKGVTLSSINV